MAEENEETEQKDRDNEEVFDADHLDKISQQQAEQVQQPPFIEKLKQLENDPLQIIPTQWPASVSFSALQEAISLLPSSSDKQFTLPGRARLGFPIDTSNPNENDDQFKVYLDKPIGELIIKNYALY